MARVEAPTLGSIAICGCTARCVGVETQPVAPPTVDRQAVGAVRRGESGAGAAIVDHCHHRVGQRHSLPAGFVAHDDSSGNIGVAQELGGLRGSRRRSCDDDSAMPDAAHERRRGRLSEVTRTGNAHEPALLGDREMMKAFTSRPSQRLGRGAFARQQKQRPVHKGAQSGVVRLTR